MEEGASTPVATASCTITRWCVMRASKGGGGEAVAVGRRSDERCLYNKGKSKDEGMVKGLEYS